MFYTDFRERFSGLFVNETDCKKFSNFFCNEFNSKKVFDSPKLTIKNFRNFLVMKGYWKCIYCWIHWKKNSKIFYIQFHWKKNSKIFQKIQKKLFCLKKGVTGGGKFRILSSKIQHHLSLGFDVISTLEQHIKVKGSMLLVSLMFFR